MDPKRRQYLEAQLSAYLDGELAAAERTEVEDFLAVDADARKLLVELEEIAAGLRALPRARVSPDLMEGLRSRLERRALLGDRPSKAPPVTTIPFSGRWLAAAAVMAMMVTAGYVMWSIRSPEPDFPTKEYVMVESANRPVQRSADGKGPEPAAPSVRRGQEKADKSASAGRGAAPGYVAGDRTLEPPTGLPPAASSDKGDSTLAAVPQSAGSAAGSASSPTFGGIQPSPTRTIDVGTTEQEHDSSIVLDHAAQGEQAALAERVARLPRRPDKEQVRVALDDETASSTGNEGDAAAVRTSKGVPTEGRYRGRMAVEATQPAALRPTMVAQAEKMKHQPERAAPRREDAAPSAPALAKADLIPQVAEAEKPGDGRGARILNRVIGAGGGVSGPPAEPATVPESTGVAAGTTREVADVAGGRRRTPARQGVDLKEAFVGEPSHHRDKSAGGGFGGMGGAGAQPADHGRSGGRFGSFGRVTGDAAYDAGAEVKDRAGTLGLSFADSDVAERFLFAAPTPGEPPWRPDTNAAPQGVFRSLWPTGYAAGKWHIFDPQNAATTGQAPGASAGESGRALTGDVYSDVQAGGQATDRRTPEAGSGVVRATGQPTTQPTSAPATAPTSQPTSPPDVAPQSSR
ncbi:MAG TPA: hypothetical protein PKY77_11120 [Phycisphaerae bacterium]|nr:hypothetical protein [Phycisphaerae bacterium]HRY66721.1 hypothetical protein [Phycisphaerae bacterium]HSA29029.1 hypothetical protein [Phycisphaerae bacterium]